MLYKQNLHTHTFYCDGEDSPREIIEEAILKGFDSIGFSGHCPADYDKFSMPKDKLADYITEITSLKQEYKGKIAVCCGLEDDFYADVDLLGFEYLIGSVHFIRANGAMQPLDFSIEATQKIIDECFGGNPFSYAKEYYSLVAQLPQKYNYDILGHMDLITKFNDTAPIIDEESKEYKALIVQTIDAIKGKIPFFEVNSGAISRGYRKTPYPSPFIINEFKERGFGAVITSDCHNKKFLDCEFDLSREILKEFGFKEHYVLKNGVFEAVSL